jgi:threonine aldolase
MPHKHLFRDDYSEGAHPRLLEALSKTNTQQEPGYGADSFTHEAEQLIIKKIKQPQARVHFVAGGTLANLTSLSAISKPYESVILTENGHPNVHEAGAVEATGHKLYVVAGVGGKLTPDAIQKVVAEHTDEHMVVPRTAYISQATEMGTVYSKKELQALSKVCRQHKLYLYVDGARIANAIMAEDADHDIDTIAELSDMFFIGGTKNGALFGEAIVIVNPNLQDKFRYHLKQRGALMAKTRAISVQFLEMFKDNLYFDNAKHANQMAQKLAKGIAECGYEFLTVSPTNQIFPILPDSIIEQLQKKYGFYVWVPNVSITGKTSTSAIRLVTSWATSQDAVNEFLSDLKSLGKT